MDYVFEEERDGLKLTLTVPQQMLDGAANCQQIPKGRVGSPEIIKDLLATASRLTAKYLEYCLRAHGCAELGIVEFNRGIYYAVDRMNYMLTEKAPGE